MILTRLVVTGLVGACLSSTLWAGETPYPTRPIRVIVPFAPGGSTDILVRLVGVKLSELIGQPVIIDNRGGAGGTIGAELAAKSAADGYTVMATTSGVIVVNKSLHSKLTYDPVADFSPITIVAALTNILVVSPSFPANSIKELLEMARAKPGALTYGSGGNGTSNHLAGELMNYLANVKVTHVPYKGGGPAVLATITGEVSMLFATIPPVVHHLKAGKLKALAVTGRKRTEKMPNLPTMIEAGVKDFEVEIWIGVLAPKGVPAARIRKLNGDIRSAIQSPEVATRLNAEGYDPVGNTPAEMESIIKRDSEKWTRVIKGAGIRAN